MNVVIELISFNDLISTDNRDFFDTNVNQNIFLSETFYSKKSVVWKRSCSCNWSCIPILSSNFSFRNKMTIC